MTIQSNFPNIAPSLMLDFANMGQIDPRVTFARGTPAVYYNGSTTALAEQNLFTYSQDFEAWSIARATLTANTTVAPDGTTTGDTLTQTSTGIYGTPYKVFITSEATYTQSIYAKAGTASWLLLGEENSGKRAWFNVSAGTVGTVASGTTATITSAGSGWYRCTVTYTLSATGGTFINAIANGDNSTAGTGGTTLIIWGAQLEQRFAVSAYTVTGATSVTNYNPQLLLGGGGQPRFDHNPTTRESLGLLIEGQRTNLVLYSAQFDQTSMWSQANVTVSANTLIAPDGTLTSDKIILDSGSSQKRINFASGTYTANTYTLSVYAKAGEYGFLLLTLFDSGYKGAVFNLTTGVIGTTVNATPSITSVGNGWYRCVITATATSTLNNAASGFWPTATDGGVNGPAESAGNGFNGLYLWGAQLEVGAFATSYIETTTAAATRLADVTLMAGNNFSSWYNNEEGTFCTEVSFAVASYNISNTYHYECSDGTSSNRLIGYTGGSVASSFVAAYGTNDVSIGTAAAPAVNTSYRCGFFYQINNFAVTASAVAPVTDNSGQMPFVNRINIGSNYSSSESLNGWIKKLAYYPQAVTSAQLQALTS
jgi:hypothetical protein